MLDEEKIALSRIRLENAKERLSFIPQIINISDYKTAANRAYYAVFSAMRAVLALDGFDSKKHSGVIAEFRRAYIKTGIFDTALSDIISELFSTRSESDYDDFYVISKEKVYEQYENALFFVTEVEKYLINKYPH